MGRWPGRTAAAALALLSLTPRLAAGPPVAGGGQRAEPPASEAEVRAAFDAGDLAAALELAGRLPDVGLAAEWRFHVLHEGGDLGGALRAAEAGLTAEENERLRENAARCALALGLGGRAAGHVERWLGIPGLGSADLERARELEREAAALLARERAARAAGSAARAVALAFAGLVVLGLALLAARGRLPAAA
jgi:hypothetical protein